MSVSLDADPPATEELVARLRRMNAETEKFISEQRKLMTESDKFLAEQRKLIAEGDKFNRERALAPWLAIIGLIGGVVTVTTVVLRAIGLSH